MGLGGEYSNRACPANVDCGGRFRYPSAAVPRATAGSPNGYGDLFVVFAFAWALATLFHLEFHYLVYVEPALAPKVTGAITAVAAFAALLRPGDPRAFAALALAQLADVVTLLPEVPNHWLLAGLVNLAWLLVMVRAGRVPAAGALLLRHARAPLLVGVALFYAFTGFWKLNHDFLRPEVSCAVVSWENLLAQFHWLPDAGDLREGVIWTTLLVELVGPLLLLVPRARRIGAPLLIVFHVLLGLDALKRFVNFASVMVALLLLYLPPSAAGTRKLAVAARRAGPVAATVYALLVAVAVAAGPAAPLYLLGRWVVWLVYAGLLVAGVLVVVLRADGERGWERSGARVAWIFPVLVVLNGIAPILGVKNRTSWQMYSNLRLEADASNHVLVPRSADLFGALSDRVVVLETSIPVLDGFVRSGLDLTWIEFRRLVASDPEGSVTYERHGVRTRVRRVADAPALVPPPFLVRKLMFFRPLGPKVAETCVW